MGIRKQMVLRPSNSIEEKVIMVKPITLEEEKNIDKLKQYRHKNFITNDVISYGVFDIESDLEFIRYKNFINDKPMGSSNWIYSNVSKDGKVYTNEDGIIKMYPTLDAVKWFLHCYNLIGRPERIIIFKCPKVYV